MGCRHIISYDVWNTSHAVRSWCNPLWLTGLKAPTNELANCAVHLQYRVLISQKLAPYIWECLICEFFFFFLRQISGGMHLMCSFTLESRNLTQTVQVLCLYVVVYIPQLFQIRLIGITTLEVACQEKVSFSPQNFAFFTLSFFHFWQFYFSPNNGKNY